MAGLVARFTKTAICRACSGCAKQLLAFPIAPVFLELALHQGRDPVQARYENEEVQDGIEVKDRTQRAREVRSPVAHAWKGFLELYWIVDDPLPTEEELHHVVFGCTVSVLIGRG